MKRKRNQHHPIKNGQIVHSPLLDDRTPYFYFVLTAIGVYIFVISYLSILRYESFSASVYDLGIMIQTIWNTSHGWILQESINMGYPMMRFWMAHWEFIYIPIALIYKLFSSPYTILIIQTAVVAFGALPVYWLAKEKLQHELLAVAFAIGYLLYPAIQNANLCDVHGVTLAAPFLLFSFYYLQKKNFKLFTLFAIIAISCREDSALLVFMMGVYSFLILKEKRVGIIAAIAGLLWFLIWYKRMTIRSMLGLPQFVIMEGAETHWDHLGQISQDPLYLVKFLAKKYNIRYFFYLFGPVALLSFFSPTTLLIAAPMFAINLLSSYYYTHDVEHYYSATITPFIYISAIYGSSNIMAYLRNQELRRKITNILPVFIAACALFFFFIKSNAFDVRKWKVIPHHKIIKKIIAKIPVEASVTAENKLAVHAAERHEIYVFNDHVNDVDYILYDFYAPTIKLITRKSFELPYYWPDNDSIRQVLHNPHYGVVEYEDGVCLLKRGAPHNEGIRRLALSTGADIVNSENKEIGEQVYFKGYRIHDILSFYIQPEKLGRIYWKKALHFTCFWTVQESVTDSVNFIFKLEKGTQSFNLNHDAVFGLYPPSHWRKNELVRDEVFWEIPEAAQKGLYRLYVALDKENEKKFVYLFDVNVE